ncbi:PTS system transporter [Klebsiella pneumoniae]|uniref:PTS system transporter n=1 Tax=Klebsiella pneumoniae TaxID=573 RepID=A0A377TZD8_KLEPN|nr:PTS system transporter [Klebsiella pneumoniae]
MINNMTVLGHDSMLPIILPAVIAQVAPCSVFSSPPAMRVSGCWPVPPLRRAVRHHRASYLWPDSAAAPSVYLGCVAGAIGGAITAFSNSYAYSFGLPNIFFPAQMIPPGGIDASVWGGLIGTGVAFVLACVLTFFAGLPRASAAPGAVTVAPASATIFCADERQRYRPRAGAGQHLRQRPAG